MLAIVIYQLIAFCFIGFNILILFKLFPDERKLRTKARARRG